MTMIAEVTTAPQAAFDGFDAEAWAVYGGAQQLARLAPVTAGVIDDIEAEDDAQGYEDAEDALRQWAVQSQSQQVDDPGICGGCGNWVVNCNC